jgi:hypothetical protein
MLFNRRMAASTPCSLKPRLQRKSLCAPVQLVAFFILFSDGHHASPFPLPTPHGLVGTDGVGHFNPQGALSQHRGANSLLRWVLLRSRCQFSLLDHQTPRHFLSFSKLPVLTPRFKALFRLELLMSVTPANMAPGFHVVLILRPRGHRGPAMASRRHGLALGGYPAVYATTVFRPRRAGAGFAGVSSPGCITTDSVHKVFSSTFEAIPNRRGSHPVRIARMSAIGAGIHAIRAGHHLCD